MREAKAMREVHHSLPKKDAETLLLGKPVYTEDLAPKDALVVKLLRSPHAHARVLEIDTSVAKKVPGVVCVLTYQDVPKTRFSIAGQTYPEVSPYDRLILDAHLRFVGDPVAIVAAESEAAAKKACRLIKVRYEILEPVLDFRKAKDHKSIVHPEDDWKNMAGDFGQDVKRNLVAKADMAWGDMEIEAALADSDIVLEEVYHTKQVHQSMMETFRAYTKMEPDGRITVVSSTQIPFHVHRIVSTALELPRSMVRVVKPRIGGGFGAKQSAVCEVYPAIVTKLTGRTAMIIYTREETQIVGSPRHEGDVRVRLGAMKDGRLRALEMSALWNAGAYGEHGFTTVGLVGNKTLSLYRHLDAMAFHSEVVYTNTVAGGAYRGYGAPQGLFALECTMAILAKRLGMDLCLLKEKNHLREGDFMPAYDGETANSCALDRCLATVKKNIGWEEKGIVRRMPNGNLRALGIALAMQGSSISNLDVAGVRLKLNDGGGYFLEIGASDMGTGCDTILAQMAAEALGCRTEEIRVYGVDTDRSPYDKGSYASSTTYLTGNAVLRTAEVLKEKMCAFAAKKLGVSQEEISFDGENFVAAEGKCMTRAELSYAAMSTGGTALEASESFASVVSPPPYMAGAAEIEIDCETGKIKLISFEAAVDCGTVINPALVRTQCEGGIVQGIGMALTEDIHITSKGRMVEDSLMQYKIPVRSEVSNIHVAFEESYEPTGPYGAKSIGEVCINTSAPAIATAVYHATGVMPHELPIRPEDVYWALKKAEKKA